MASPDTPPPTPPAGPKKPRDWAPRVWQGCDYFSWLRLLFRNRFAVEPPYWYIAGIASCLTFGNTVLRWLQEGMYGDRIDATPVRPPVFVIGHWRTGTTLLHELLSLDDRFTSPTTLQCFAPCSFLLSEDFYKKYLGFAVPEKRPMDNMAAGWDRPQEDEFALALLGLPSPYTDFAFPNRPPLDPGSLDLSGLSPRELAAWKRTFLRFLKAVQFRSPRKRLVLKSPPHTARVPVLLEMFPDAKFVHIVRDPYVVYPSTVNLWTAFGKKQGFQTPRTPQAVKEKVVREFRTVYDRLETAKPLIPPGNYVEVRYEDLVKDVVAGVEKVYDGLSLPGFAVVRPKLEAFAAGNKGYETNKWSLTPEERAHVGEYWGDIIERLGYEK
jgi:hypothetical protein